MTVQSDGNVKPLAPDGYAVTVHRFEKPGRYLVRVERTGPGGARRWPGSRCGLVRGPRNSRRAAGAALQTG